jgi:hypothetical protein
MRVVGVSSQLNLRLKSPQKRVPTFPDGASWYSKERSTKYGTSVRSITGGTYRASCRTLTQDRKRKMFYLGVSTPRAAGCGVYLKV